MIKSKTAVRLAALAGLSFAGVSAHALTIDFVTAGTTVLPVPSTIVSTESIIYQVTNPVAPALTSYTATIANGPLPVPGTATATDGGANTLLMGLTVASVVSNGGFISGDGTWTYAGGTGAYGGFASGGGTFAFSWDISAGLALGKPFPSYTSVVGQLNPVPEPASMAIVGLGLVGLVARRRRS